MMSFHKTASGRAVHRTAALSMLLCMVSSMFLPALLAGCSVHAMEASVTINEVVSSNSHSLTDPVLGSPDWIELYNPTSQSINLTGYRLTDKPDSAKGALPDVTIPAGGYTVIFADKGGDQKDSDKSCVDFSLSKGGVKLYLFNSENILVTQLVVPALPADVSYARRDDGTYGYCASPTPGAANSSAGILDADSLKNVLQSGTLRLNEILPKVAGASAWAEVYNAGQTSVDLGDYCLTDLQNNPAKWHFPSGALEPGKYAVVYLSGQDKASPEMHTSFKLGGDDTALYLYDIMGNLVSDITWYKEIPQGVSVLAGNRYTAFPTKGAENSQQTFASIQPAAMDSSDPVRLNEVLPHNKYSAVDADGDREEWIELYNGSTQAVNLKNYFLTDSQNDLFKWQFPDVVMEAGSYRIVFLSGKQSHTGELHASFRLSAGEGVWLTSFGAGGIRTDGITPPATIGENISVGRDAQGHPLYYAQPTPSAPNARGFTDPALAVPFDKNGLYISEVCAANKAKSGLNDWIELHNAAAADMDLTGYTLSDDPAKPGLFTLQGLTVKAGGYAVVEASNNPANAKIAGFGISPTGETLLLRDAQGTLVDRLDTGVLSPGVTCGRKENADSAARVYFAAPTRGKANSADTLAGYTATPVISDSSLYHKQSFEVSITCATPSAKIYYTTDGSVPTSASKVYAGPVTISKNTPVRAVAYTDGCLPSETATQTYLFDDPHTVPVICLSGNPSDINVLLKFSKEKNKPEFAGNAEYYEKDGSLGVEFPTGIRSKGRASLRNPQKSYTLALGSNFGQKSVTYPFFPDSSNKTYHQLTIRNSGQDLPRARMRDTLIHRICDGMDVTSIETRIVVVYINGKYEGIFDLEEEQNTDYLATRYNVDANKIDMINRNGIVMRGTDTEYHNVVRMAQHWNMADDKVFAEFAKYVDVDACIDYLVVQTYFGNGDIVNTRFWRTQDYSEKWQPLLFDLDFCLRFNDVNRNTFGRYLIPTPHLGGTEIAVNQYIICALKKNAAWRDKFVQRYIQLAETQFAPDRVTKIFDDLKAEMKPEMAMDIEKWHMPSSMQYWEKQTDGLRAALIKRQSIALHQMQIYFRVPSATMQKYIDMYAPKK